MKKPYFKIWALSMAMILFHIQVLAAAAPSNIKSVESNYELEIYDAFNEIEGLVSFLNENETANYESLQAINSNLIDNVSSSAAVAMNSAEREGPPVMNPFLWGCIFSWVGLIVVYATTDSNKAYTNSAWKGCLVGSVLWAVFSVGGGCFFPAAFSFLPFLPMYY